MGQEKDLYSEFKLGAGNSRAENEGRSGENVARGATNAPKARPSCFHSTFEEVLFVLTATMAVSISSFFAGTVAVCSSYIGQSLDMTTAEITWITSANSLSAGAFLLFFGKIADVCGKKALFVGSLFLFAVFALAIGFANTSISVDILSGVLGLMSASSVPPAVGILGSSYENGKRKNYAFACFSAGNPLGFLLGAIVGGAASTILDWRAAFWLMAIIFLIFSIIGVFTVPRDPAGNQALFNKRTLKSFDLLGVMFIVAGIGMFSAALSLGATLGWSTSYVLALLIIGICLVAAFVFWEMRCQCPLIPMHIFKDRNYSVSLAILSLGFMAFIPGSFFLALFFQHVWHLSPLMVAVHLLPMFLVGIGINAIAGMILHRVSSKLIMAVATASYPIGFTMLALNTKGSSYWTFAFIGQMFIVIAVDFQFNVCNMTAIKKLPTSEQSVAGSILQTAVRLATTVGFGIATALYSLESAKLSISSYWDEETQPYACVFWASMAYSALSLCLVPLLKVGKHDADVDAEG